MGHTDTLVISDAGLPVPAGVERVDLAVTRGLPRLLEIVRVVAAELQVERITLAEELDPALAAELAAIFPTAAINRVPHERFKMLTERATAVVRTGEMTPYANIILTSGVTF